MMEVKSEGRLFSRAADFNWYFRLAIFAEKRVNRLQEK